MSGPKFPSQFVWGAGTSAFQIEGATVEGGRGPSIWDRFCQEPERILDGSDGRIACDHYHRWETDLDIMAELGLQAYRFSIAWPRVIPEGKGTLNLRGLDFYSRLIDGLLDRGIQPWITLYHWDLPLALEAKGGWLNRDTARCFADYAAAMFERFGDRVKHWTTHNEPWCVSMLGYRYGQHAPGQKNPEASLIAAHHVLLSHGWALQAMRTLRQDRSLGIVLNLCPAYPARPTAEDQAAATIFDGQYNRWFLDPIFKAHYPIDILPLARRESADSGLSFIRDGDLAVIAQPLDFLGINYYSRVVVQADPKGEVMGGITVPPDPDLATSMGWEVFPQGLEDLLVRVHQEYKPEQIFVTENGAAFHDTPDASGRVADQRRVDYLQGHFLALLRSIDQGVPLGGYFQWSLLDNFEWAFGYTQRFGMVYVDYSNQRRILKDSASWYRDVIRRHGL